MSVHSSAPRPKPSRPRTPRRRLTKEARREEILDAALKAFCRTGYHGTHVDAVIREAGVARGTFYLHFESKHAVFEALVDRMLEIFLDARPAFEEPPVRTIRDAEEILRRSYTAILTTVHRHRRLATLLFDEAVGIDKGFQARLEEHYRVWHERVAMTLRYFQQAGVVRMDLDVDVTAQMVLGIVERLCRRYLFRAQAPDVAGLVEEIVAFELRGTRA